MAKTIERLGESEAGPGFELLRLLSMQGWAIDILGNGKGGVLVRASKLGHLTVEVEGASVADVATAVVEEATGMRSDGRLH